MKVSTAEIFSFSCGCDNQKVLIKISQEAIKINLRNFLMSMLLFTERERENTAAQEPSDTSINHHFIYFDLALLKHLRVLFMDLLSSSLCCSCSCVYLCCK
jgi:hypothetical protein